MQQTSSSGDTFGKGKGLATSWLDHEQTHRAGHNGPQQRRSQSGVVGVTGTGSVHHRHSQHSPAGGGEGNVGEIEGWVRVYMMG